MVDARTDRWVAHPVWAGVVRVAVILVPLALSVLTAVVVGRWLPVGESRPARVGWWLLIFAISSLVLFVSDRLARRLLPLAVLLELSLVFPDRAPSRLRKVRGLSVRQLDERLSRLRAHGATTPPIEAAETLVALVGMLGVHDKRTRGHSERVRALVDLLTDEMGLTDEERGKARWAALVHDIGKLATPVSVLNKPGALDEDEWEAIRQHPHEGARLAAGLLPWLGDWGRAIEEHHERWDGLGYPRGLAGEQISLSARIVSVADSYEVMTTNRSYSKARSAAVARKELTDCAGAQFDPQVVRCFLSISLGRLRWLYGPLTWLASVPFLALDRAGQAARLATASIGVGGLAVAGTIAPPASAEPGASPRPGSAATPFRAIVVPAPAGPAKVGTPVALPTVGASPTRTASAPASSPAVLSGPTRAVRPSPTGSAQAGPVAPTSSPGASPSSAPPTDYWFAADGAGYTFTRTAPSQEGSPADTDQDGRPGKTVRPTGSGVGTRNEDERLLLELELDRSLRVAGVPTLVLWSRLAADRGNARVLVRMEDCPDAGPCTVLAEGKVEDGTWSPDGFVAHDIALSRVDATVEAGRRLRLTLVAADSGTSGDLWVAVGSRAAPSRLVLPVSTA